MKKIINLTIITIACFMIGISYVNAEEEEVYCPTNFLPAIIGEEKEVKKGEEIKVSYSIPNTMESVELAIELDDKVFELKEVEITKVHSIDYKDLEKITIKRKEMTNDPVTVNFIFEVLKDADEAHIIFDNQVAKCDGDSIKADKIQVNFYTKSDNALLQNLFISDGMFTEDFDPNKKEYTFNVNEGITELTVAAQAENLKATVSGDIGTVNVADGDVIIVVKSETGKEEVYTIKLNTEVVKLEPNLISLFLSAGYLDFKPNIYNYDVSVPNFIDSVEVYRLALDPLAEVTIDAPEELVVGSNRITVTVLNPDGATKVYTINLTRLAVGANDAALSSNNYLSNLVIAGYEINFSKNIYEYVLKLPDEPLDITYETEDPNAKVSIQGNENLGLYSVVTIIVTAENGMNQIYEIKFLNEDAIPTLENAIPDEDNTMTYIIIGAVLIVLLGGATFVLIQSKRGKLGKKKTPKNQTPPETL